MTPKPLIAVSALCLLWPTIADAQRSAPTAADIRAQKIAARYDRMLSMLSDGGYLTAE